MLPLWSGDPVTMFLTNLRLVVVEEQHIRSYFELRSMQYAFM